MNKIDGAGAVAFGTGQEAVASLPEVIHQNIRRDILVGSLSPGQALRQEELAKRFGVSRVPLREAMSRLEGEGLVVLRPRRGYIVTSLNPNEIIEVFELRMAVEEHAGLVATRARTEVDVREVAALTQSMEALAPEADDYMLEWARLNREFHARLFASSGRKRVCRTAAALRDAVEPYIRVEARMTGHFKEAHTEHREIFAAFEAGFAPLVGQLSRQHCESTLNRLLRFLAA